MQREDKKSDRIPVSTKTRMRLKKFYVINNFKNYDEAIISLIERAEKK